MDKLLTNVEILHAKSACQSVSYMKAGNDLDKCSNELENLVDKAAI